MYCVPGVKVANSAGLVADVFVSKTVPEPDVPVRSTAVYVTSFPLSDTHVTWSLLLSDPGLRSTEVGALGAGSEHKINSHAYDRKFMLRNRKIIMHKAGK